MKKTAITILLALVCSLAAKAQFSIHYNAGVGQYEMKDMKNLAKYAFDLGINSGEAPQGVKMTDNFPAYATHGFDILYKLNRHEFGIKGTYMTTGATYAYSDYSGKLQSKLIANGYRLGAVYRFHFYEKEIGKHTLSIFAELSPGITFTRLTAKEDSEIYGVIKQKEKENLNGTMNGASIQPLAGVRFALYKHIIFTGSLGYDFEFGATLGPQARVDWSGFRCNAGVGYSF